MQKHPHKILLIEPPFYRLFKDTYSLDRYPLALGYLSGAVKGETNWDVLTYNADFNPKNEIIKLTYLTGKGFYNYLNNLKDLSASIWQEIKATIQEYKPCVIGISAKSQNFASVRIVAKFAKELDRQTIIIVGGPHASLVGQDIFKCPDIDVCVRGEGEKTIVELLNAIEAQQGFDGIKGVIFRKGGRVIENTVREFIQDLDSLCFPYEYASEVLRDYTHYPMSAFKYIFATRGCPYECFFCGSRKIWGRTVRFRSAESITEEIRGLQKKGLRSVHFSDDTFGVTKQYIRELCDAIIKDCSGIKWSCELHVKLVDEEMIALMKGAGCFGIVLGIESGNNYILKAMKKNLTIEEAFSAVEIIRKHGLELHVFFMVGFPHETEDTLNDTISAIKKINCDSIIYSIFTPYPGTDAFTFCKESGLIDDNYDISLYNHQSPANCFCINITPERFRLSVSKIEKLIDRKNSIAKLRRIFSMNTLWRFQERGIIESFKKGINILIGR